MLKKLISLFLCFTLLFSGPALVLANGLNEQEPPVETDGIGQKILWWFLGVAVGLVLDPVEDKIKEVMAEVTGSCLDQAMAVLYAAQAASDAADNLRWAYDGVFDITTDEHVWHVML